MELWLAYSNSMIKAHVVSTYKGPQQSIFTCYCMNLLSRSLIAPKRIADSLILQVM